MNQLVKSTAMTLLAHPVAQSYIESGLYKVAGPDSITSSCIRAAERFAEVLSTRKPSGPVAKLASEFYANGAGRVLLQGRPEDFDRVANMAIDRAELIEAQLNGESSPVPEPAPITAASLVGMKPEEILPVTPKKEEAVPGANVAPTPAAAQAAAPKPEPEPQLPEHRVEPTPAAGQVIAPPTQPAAPTVDKPADVPVEELAKHGIPAKLIETLVAAGLTTAKAVRDRDAQTQITELPDVGPAIRKKILAAIDAEIA